MTAADRPGRYLCLVHHVRHEGECPRCEHRPYCSAYLLNQKAPEVPTGYVPRVESTPLELRFPELEDAPLETSEADALVPPDYGAVAFTAQPVPAPGTKHDQAKPRMDLLDRLWLEEVAKVLTFGAQKYAAHNWRGGIAQSRLVAAALRHLMAHNCGEDTDPETGLPHLAHASCCLMFATNLMVTRPDLDDRFK